VEAVRNLAAQGLSISEVARTVGIAWQTAKKYAAPDFTPESKAYGSSYPVKLKPFTDTIDSMLSEQRKFGEIEGAIRAIGYTGASSTIRMYATRKRNLLKEARSKAGVNTEIIERKWVQKLLYHPIEKVKGITESQVSRIIDEYPVIGHLLDIVKSFKAILFSKRVEDLEGWMSRVVQMGFDEVNEFIGGLKRDLVAVKNAIRYEYNNGLAEGSVNKLKVIKRIMYGRHSFKLLRHKLLLREKYR
jgi:hypothetical protein